MYKIIKYSIVEFSSTGGGLALINIYFSSSLPCTQEGFSKGKEKKWMPFQSAELLCTQLVTNDKSSPHY